MKVCPFTFCKPIKCQQNLQYNVLSLKYEHISVKSDLEFEIRKGKRDNSEIIFLNFQ